MGCVYLEFSDFPRFEKLESVAGGNVTNGVTEAEGDGVSEVVVEVEDKENLGGFIGGCWLSGNPQSTKCGRNLFEPEFFEVMCWFLWMCSFFQNAEEDNDAGTLWLVLL